MKTTSKSTKNEDNIKKLRQPQKTKTTSKNKDEIKNKDNIKEQKGLEKTKTTSKNEDGPSVCPPFSVCPPI